MRRSAAVLLTLSLLGCPGVLTKTDAALVGDSLAARIYQLDRFERLCPHDADNFFPTAPAGCATMTALLAEWKHSNSVADEVIKKGNLPSQEKTEIRDVMRKVARLP
jgi:hypothetical protein